MKEKMYKLMTVAGAGNIAIGVLIIVVGVTAGVVSIVTGAKLLKEKQNIGI